MNLAELFVTLIYLLNERIVNGVRGDEAHYFIKAFFAFQIS
jgi:hypothetical protein